MVNQENNPVSSSVEGEEAECDDQGTAPADVELSLEFSEDHFAAMVPVVYPTTTIPEIPW